VLKVYRVIDLVGSWNESILWSLVVVI